MDYEEKKRKQVIRILIADIGMVIAVLAIVAVTLMLSMGFFISDNGTIEQSGLMQIRSLPTGASVELDGTILFSRTNTSRTMSAGKHTLKLSREGYTGWEKEIEMYSGVLIRLHYPRLFLLNRMAEKVRTLTMPDTEGEMSELAFYSVSPKANFALYAVRGEKKWGLLDIQGDTVRESQVNISEAIAGEVESIVWSENEKRVLIRERMEDRQEWVLLDLASPKDSINLTTVFGFEFSQVEMMDTSAHYLFGLENGRLHKIDATTGQISKVLLSNLEKIAVNGTELAYVTKVNEKTNLRSIGTYRDGDEAGVKVVSVPAEKAVHVQLTKFYNEKYLCYTVDGKLTVLHGTLPVYRADAAVASLEIFLEEDLKNVPESLNLSANGEYVLAVRGAEFAVLELETGIISEYEALASTQRWLDEAMLYTVLDGEIIAWDFDGANLRNLAGSLAEKDGKKLAQGALDMEVRITNNGKWMYYLTQAETGAVVLTREKIKD